MKLAFAFLISILSASFAYADTWHYQCQFRGESLSSDGGRAGEFVWYYVSASGWTKEVIAAGSCERYSSIGMNSDKCLLAKDKMGNALECNINTLGQFVVAE